MVGRTSGLATGRSRRRTAARARSELLGYVELHIEQGPKLDASGLKVGVAYDIGGRGDGSFNDAAADVPPISNLWNYTQMGFDLVTFSGGKGLSGPQCSGLLLGRKDLIEAALMNCNPREGAVCRPMKVGKEEIIGCLTALETWLKMDEKKIYAEWNDRINRIRKLVDTVPGVKTETYVPDDGNRYSTLNVLWD